MNVLKKYIYFALLLALFCLPNKALATDKCKDALKPEPSLEEAIKVIKGLPDYIISDLQELEWLHDLKRLEYGENDVAMAKLSHYVSKAAFYDNVYNDPGITVSILDVLVYVATREDDIDSVRIFLKAGANVNGVKGYIPLLASIYGVGYNDHRGNVEIARLLVEYGADPNLVIQKKTEDLIDNRNLEMAKLIFGHEKTNVNESDSSGWTPIARILHNISFIEGIIREHPEDEIAVNSLKAYEEMKDMVIQNPNFRINTLSKGRTPLSFAAFRSYPHLIKPLLELGADPNIPETTRATPGATPLLRAIDNRYKKDSSVYTYTYLSVEQSRDNAREIIISLLKAGADPNIPDTHGDTPISRTIDEYYNDSENRDRAREMAMLLLEHGADPAVGNSAVWATLSFAFETDDREAASRILKNPRTYLQLVPSIRGR